MPAAMAVLAEEGGIKRASLDPMVSFVLSVLAGAFVAFGAIFATTVLAGTMTTFTADGTLASSAVLPYGIGRLLAGLAFCVGIIAVIIAGAELFTGNNLIVMAWASGKVTTSALMFNWVLVFTGNCVGAILTAGLMFLTTQYTFGGGAVGLVALNTANAKAALPLVPAFTLGIMCNALVCLAVWMCYSARTNVDRVLTAVPPVAAFAAAGFEHCIANVYFIPMGLFIKAGAPDSFWKSVNRTAADFPDLTWSNFICNLVPVTAGNILGGSLMVAAAYWFVYLRKRADQPRP
ncbi:MAG: formate/nitrite transporter family protein [Bradyrhizobium sp.]